MDQLSGLEQILSLRTGRRGLLLGTGAVAGLMLSRSVGQPAIAAQTPFTLGVASGDPLPDGFVIWTRLAPDPLNGGGMSSQPVPVRWQVATDAKLRQVVQQGSAIALPELGHSIHVEVGDLEPSRWYWYRFQVGAEVSPVGRSRTAPALGAKVDRIRFAFAACQHYETGYFTAYRDMATANLDFVVHLGDYIYEGGSSTGTPRQHNSAEILTLVDYRNRYALYKLDTDLQAAHAAFPWIMTWDDHEVDNNYANLTPEDSQTPAAFAQRRAAAYQAYYEHLPLRRSSLPKGANLPLFRRLTFGDLATLHVLDTRQYRTDQPCGDQLKPRCAEALSTGTMLGTQQEKWLFAGLSQSQTRWNVLAQGVMMGQFDIDPRPETELFGMDGWDGYVLSRDRLFNFLNQQRPNNPIVITGDVHSSWVHDLKLDFKNPNSATVGTEFIATSISSNFSKENIPCVEAALSSNPHTRFFDGAYRGYVLCDLTQQRWQTEFRGVSFVNAPNGAVSTTATFVVESAQAGATQV